MMSGMARMSAMTPAQPKTPVLKIGFYGCNDGLVRLSYREPRRTYPKHLKLQCPRCRRTHDVNPSWRKVVPADEGKKPTWLG